MGKSKSIPISVDPQTHERLGKIAVALGFGERNRRKVVGKLVSQEYARLLAAQLILGEKGGSVDTDSSNPGDKIGSI